MTKLRGDVQPGPWVKAFYTYIDKPKYTNREASGLIKFARNVVNTFGKQPNVSLTEWDWYAYALVALGWRKTGDKFKVDTSWQLQPYAASPQLRAALLTMAAELDEVSVPFKPSDPRGTDATFRAMASDAWQAMQNLRAQGLHEGGKVPEELSRVWEPTSLDAATMNTNTKREPEQLDLPHTAQPVGKPVPSPASSKGGGAIWLLLLAAVASTRRKRNGRR